MKSIYCITLATIISLPAFCANEVKLNAKIKTIELSSQESTVEFLAVGKPSMLKITGTGGKLKGHVDFSGLNVTAECIVPLDTVTTGIDLRDRHMKNKYLETSKFPEATLVITDLILEKNYLLEQGEQKNVPFKGKLKIHGEESNVEGLANLISDNKTITILAITKTNITAHKIDVPSYLGVKVADEVEIKVNLKIKKEK